MHRRRLRGQARPALLWMLFFFLGGHLLLGLYLFQSHLECCDPEFALRLRNLQARLAESPERPLALAVGSSRMAFGLRPASVLEQTSEEQPRSTLFNFAMLGTGPVGERLVLHRVLTKGIKPKWLFVEVWAPFLPQRDFSNEETILFRRDTYLCDLPMISRLYHRRWEAAGRVLTETLTPLLHYRVGLLNRCAPELVPPLLVSERQFNDHLQSHLDGSGWVPFAVDQDDPAGSRIHIERAQRMTKPLFDRFQISAVSEEAMHEMLEECRANDIQVALLLMPEHSLLRSWYPAMQARLTAYLRRVGAAYQAPIIDARAWHADMDIPDCCHLSPDAARSFSERFGREVYGPLLEGRPLASDVLLHESDNP